MFIWIEIDSEFSFLFFFSLLPISWTSLVSTSEKKIKQLINCQLVWIALALLRFLVAFVILFWWFSLNLFFHSFPHSNWNWENSKFIRQKTFRTNICGSSLLIEMWTILCRKKFPSYLMIDIAGKFPFQYHH